MLSNAREYPSARLTRALHGLGALVLFSAAASVGAVTLPPELHGEAATPVRDLDLLADAPDHWTIEVVTQTDVAQAFERVEGGASPLGPIDSVHWMRFPISNVHSESFERILELDDPLLSEAELYVTCLSIGAESGHTRFVPSPRFAEPGHRRPVFRLAVPPHETCDVHVRVVAGVNDCVRLTLHDPETFERSSRYDAYVQGLFYGAMLIMAFYNASLFVSLRDRTYLYYSTFILALALSTFAWDGLARAVVGAEWQRLHRAALTVFDALAAVCGVQFTRHYLDTRARTPRLDRLLRVVLWASLLAVLLASPPTWPISLYLMAAVSLIGPLLLLAEGVIRLRHGYRPARVYLMALTVLLLGLVVDTWFDDFSEAGGGAVLASGLGIYGGSIVMVVLFSLGLADRYNENLRQRERVEAENRALQIMSYKDGLTGVWNRRRFDEQLAQEWSRAARERSDLSLLLIDVDCFKRFNDHYGHQAGDDCLRRVARTLDIVAARPADLVARYGGEEFAVLLPNVDGEGAVVVAETMRRAVANLAIPHAQSTAADHVSISVGVAACHVDARSNAESLIENADTALYRSKETGRNRVTCFAEAMPPPAASLFAVQSTVDVL